MADYHTTYKGPEGETTQWEDIQTRLGNLPAREKPAKAAPFAPAADKPRDKDWLDEKDAEELSDLEDEFADDRFLEEYRQKRIAELQQAAAKPRFGSVEEIRGSEFVQKVSNAGADIWVVVHLYKEGHPGCRLLGRCYDELAAKHPETKFVSIVSTDCIPNYPDANLPTTLVYNNTHCVKHIVGLRMFGGLLMSPELVAAGLNAHGPICGKTDEKEVQRQIKDLVDRLVKQREEEGADGRSGDVSD